MLESLKIFACGDLVLRKAVIVVSDARQKDVRQKKRGAIFLSYIFLSVWIESATPDAPAMADSSARGLRLLSFGGLMVADQKRITGSSEGDFGEHRAVVARLDLEGCRGSLLRERLLF